MPIRAESPGPREIRQAVSDLSRIVAYQIRNLLALQVARILNVFKYPK